MPRRLRRLVLLAALAPQLVLDALRLGEERGAVRLGSGLLLDRRGLARLQRRALAPQLADDAAGALFIYTRPMEMS